MQDVNAVQYSLIKSKLSKGWSYPLQRSVLDDALFSVPGIQVRTVHYAHHIHKFKYDGVKVLSIRYSGILDALAPGGYSISLWSVPSKFKNEISLQIAENVLPEILDWIRALEVASMTTRERA